MEYHRHRNASASPTPSSDAREAGRPDLHPIDGIDSEDAGNNLALSRHFALDEFHLTRFKSPACVHLYRLDDDRQPDI
jgi:hypothetical protein